jgi:tetratricopeptide (TPR) repeat protein
MKIRLLFLGAWAIFRTVRYLKKQRRIAVELTTLEGESFVASCFEHLNNPACGWHATLRPAAPLSEVEEARQIPLPGELKEFYRYCDGFASDSDEFPTPLLPIRELKRGREYQPSVSSLLQGHWEKYGNDADEPGMVSVFPADDLGALAFNHPKQSIPLPEMDELVPLYAPNDNSFPAVVVSSTSSLPVGTVLDIESGSATCYSGFRHWLATRTQAVMLSAAFSHGFPEGSKETSLSIVPEGFEADNPLEGAEQKSLPHLLYSATTPNGQKKHGYIEAASVERAREILSSQGLTEIRFNRDAAVSMHRTDLEHAGEKEAERLAEFELKMLRKPSLATFLREVVRQNKWLIISGMALIAWGLYRGTQTSWLVGAFSLLIGFGVPLWNYRKSNLYTNFLRASSLGQWKEVQLLLEKLRRHVKDDNILFDLAIREAQVKALQGQIPDEMSVFDKWKDEIEKNSPGLFQNRVAAIYHCAGNYPAFIANMKAASMAAPSNQSFLLDLALAEARVGNQENAMQILDGIDADLLPSVGTPFLDWANGILALRRNDPSAYAHLARAVDGFMEYANNPVAWTGLALCSGAYALALAREGKPDQARSVIKQVWPILKLYGDKPLLIMLKREVSAN